MKTRTLLIVLLVTIIIAFALEGLETLLFPDLKVFRQVLETLSTGLFYVGYGLLFLMLPVSAFRPSTRFSRHGEVRARVHNILLNVALIVVITVAGAAMIAYNLG